MGTIANVTNGLFDATNAATSIINDHLKKEAALVTTQKKIQLQAEINAKLMEISSNGKWNTWNTEIQNFFEQIKGEMSNENSKFYCKNNLQAEMFDQTLSDSYVNVSNRVALMAMQRQNEQHLVNNNKAKMSLINDGVAGADFVLQSNELDNAAEEAGLYTPSDIYAATKENVKTGVETIIKKLYKDSVNDAIKNEETPETFWLKIKDYAKTNMSVLGSITDGMDLESMYANHENDIKQHYIAAIKDMQQQNENKLSEFNLKVNQAKTDTDRINAKDAGQEAMKSMMGFQLTADARNKYGLLFSYNLEDEYGTGSGSGSGSDDGNGGSLEKMLKVMPLTAIQMIRSGEVQNFGDAVITLSASIKDKFFKGDYSESKNMSDQQKMDLWKMQYEGQTSQESIENAILNEISILYPNIGNLVAGNFAALREDADKNPGKYGKAETEKLCDFLADVVSGATKYTSEKDLLEQFKKYVNDWYISRIKYVELDTKGNLKKTFNAGSVKGVSEAARFANEHDFVYTRNGEQWAPGKKEALEAAGGVNDVLMSAVKSTLDVPADERLAVKYKLDAEHNDMTSTPIFSYKGNDYEVLPGENNKSFSVKNLTTGEVIAGKLADKGKLKAERDAGKAEAGEKVNAAHQKTVDIRQKRADETNNAIMDSKTMPKAMQNAGAVKNEEWENSKDFTARQVYLGDTVTAIDKDAKSVKANKMSEADFMRKYGISYADWIKNKETTYRFNLILNSN